MSYPTFQTRRWAPPSKAMYYGVNQVGYGTTGTPDRDDTCAAQLATMGGNCVRIGWDWSATQPTSSLSSIFWSGLDGIVNKALPGTQITFCFFGVPSWANGGLSTIGVPTYMSANDLYCQQAFAAFLGAAAARYKGNGIIFEIGNEQNTNNFWRENDSASATPKWQQFLSWYNLGRASIKAADPTARVIPGGLTAIAAWSGSGASTGLTYLQNLMNAGIVADMISIHPYCLDAGGASHSPFVDNYATGNSWPDVGRIQTLMVNGGSDGNGKPYAKYPIHIGEAGFWSAAAVGGESIKAGYVTKILTDVLNKYGVAGVGMNGAPVMFFHYFELNNATNGTIDTGDQGLWTGTPLAGPNIILASGLAFQSFMASLP